MFRKTLRLAHTCRREHVYSKAKRRKRYQTQTQRGSLWTGVQTPHDHVLAPRSVLVGRPGQEARDRRREVERPRQELQARSQATLALRLLGFQWRGGTSAACSLGCTASQSRKHGVQERTARLGARGTRYGGGAGQRSAKLPIAQRHDRWSRRCGRPSGQPEVRGPGLVRQGVPADRERRRDRWRPLRRERRDQVHAGGQPAKELPGEVFQRTSRATYRLWSTCW